MTRMRPLNGTKFVINRIHAEMFTPVTREECRKLQQEVDALQSQGTFELRKC